MADSTLEQMLRDYLQGVGDRDEQITTALQKLTDEMLAHDRKDEVRFLEVIHLGKGNAARIDVIERQLEKVEEAELITGQHNLEEIRAKALSMKAHAVRLQDDQKQWIRLVVGSLITIFGGLVLALLIWALKLK